MGDIYSFWISPNIRPRRSTDSFVVPFTKTKLLENQFVNLGSKISNDLNQDIKAFASANSSKHALKRRFFQISSKYLKSNKN